MNKSSGVSWSVPVSRCWEWQFQLLHETTGKIIKDTEKPGIMGSLLCYFWYENHHSLCEIVFQQYFTGQNY